jgi:hypothetical protein
MPNLPRHLSDAVNDLAGREISVSRRPPGRVEQAVTYGVAIEEGRGIVRAARVRALEYVATEALQATAGLTELESLYIQRSPLGSDRYKAIADTAAVMLANIVAEAGRD